MQGRSEHPFEARPRHGRGLSAAIAAIAIASILTGLGVATGQRAVSAPVATGSSVTGDLARTRGVGTNPRSSNDRPREARVGAPVENQDAATTRPRWMDAWMVGLGADGRSSWGSASGGTRVVRDRDSQREAARPNREVAEEAVRVSDPEIRIFDGRPIRAVRMLVMRVTAYSPDARSCGDSADGITASGYPVETNGGHLVAADPSLLPLGSLVSVPGYDGGDVVPVLDVGGAIKGDRLDVLFPTHERALRWGVQELEVTVWEYADGKPSGFRRMRQPKRAN